MLDVEIDYAKRTIYPILTNDLLFSFKKTREELIEKF